MLDNISALCQIIAMNMTNKDVSEISSENPTYVVWSVYHQDSDIVKKFVVINKVLNKIHSSWDSLMTSRAVAADLNKEIEQKRKAAK